MKRKSEAGRGDGARVVQEETRNLGETREQALMCMYVPGRGKSTFIGLGWNCLGIEHGGPYTWSQESGRSRGCRVRRGWCPVLQATVGRKDFVLGPVLRCI